MKPRDIKIINELRRNSRASLTQIGITTDTPLSSVFKKVIRIQRSPVFIRHTALLDFAGAGYPFKVGVILRTSDKSQLEEFLKKQAGLNSLFKVSGEYQYYAELIFKNMQEYGDFTDRLSQTKAAKKFSTHFIIDIKQEEFKIPEVTEPKTEVEEEEEEEYKEECPKCKSSDLDYEDEQTIGDMEQRAFVKCLECNHEFAIHSKWHITETAEEEEEERKCDHPTQDEISVEFDDEGMYRRMKCARCGDKLTYYYSLINVHNDTKGIEEQELGTDQEGIRELDTILVKGKVHKDFFKVFEELRQKATSEQKEILNYTDLTKVQE